MIGLAPLLADRVVTTLSPGERRTISIPQSHGAGYVGTNIACSRSRGFDRRPHGVRDCVQRHGEELPKKNTTFRSLRSSSMRRCEPLKARSLQEAYRCFCGETALLPRFSGQLVRDKPNWRPCLGHSRRYGGASGQKRARRSRCVGEVWASNVGNKIAWSANKGGAGDRKPFPRTCSHRLWPDPGRYAQDSARFRTLIQRRCRGSAVRRYFTGLVGARTMCC